MGSGYVGLAVGLGGSGPCCPTRSHCWPEVASISGGRGRMLIPPWLRHGANVSIVGEALARRWGFKGEGWRRLVRAVFPPIMPCVFPTRSRRVALLAGVGCKRRLKTVARGERRGSWAIFVCGIDHLGQDYGDTLAAHHGILGTEEAPGGLFARPSQGAGRETN